MNNPLFLIVVMFAVMWFLMIRPQRKRQHAQKMLLASLAPGDEVLTVGGLYGIIRELEDNETIVVEIADRILVRVSRRAVASAVKAQDGDDEEVVEEADADDAATEDEQVDTGDR